MTKQHLIESIRRYNPTAGEAFLADFEEPALYRYLRHLRYRDTPRDAECVWIRPQETPAIVGRDRPRRPAKHKRDAEPSELAH